MALPENQGFAPPQTEFAIVNYNNLLAQAAGEIAVAAAVPVPEIIPEGRHIKITDPHKRTIHRAREAGRRGLF